MVYGNSNKHIKKSSDYEYAKILISNTPFSEETKKKQSESHKGIMHTEESKRKISLSHIGKILSEETKIKLSENQKGKSLEERCGEEKAKEMKIKMHNKLLGNTRRKNKVFTEEQRKRLSDAHKNNPFPKILCKYCNKMIGSNNYTRYHMKIVNINREMKINLNQRKINVYIVV
jgi:hypothetical protein